MDYSSKQSEALFIVAQHAVLVFDYGIAVRAAAATPYKSEQARSLSFVARCAIEDGLYDVAAEAASKIIYKSDRDSLKIKVIEARKRAFSTSELSLSDTIRVNRTSMACFDEVR